MTPVRIDLRSAGPSVREVAKNSHNLYKNTVQDEGCAMSAVQRVNVLQGSIDQLERVSALLTDEVARNDGVSSPQPVADRLSKEALLGISVLLPKLRAVRNFSALADAERAVSFQEEAAGSGEQIDDSA